MMPGFPSYCADLLMMKTSPVTCCRCSCIRHRGFRTLASTTGRFRFAFATLQSSSYRFLQTPAFATDAVARRILFPMNWVRSLTSSNGVCQLRSANKKEGLGGSPRPSQQYSCQSRFRYKTRESITTWVISGASRPVGRR